MCEVVPAEVVPGEVVGWNPPPELSSTQAGPADRVEKEAKVLGIREGVGGHDVGRRRSKEDAPDRDLDLLAVQRVGESGHLYDPVRHVARRVLVADRSRYPGGKAVRRYCC